MREVARFTILACIATVMGLGACSDRDDRGPGRDDISGISADATPGTCDVVRDISNRVRDFFNVPEKQTAIAIAHDINAACSDGDQTALSTHALSLLALIEAVLNSGNAATASAGPTLANALLACTTSLCLAAANPTLDLAAAFAQYGLFALRGEDMAPAIAREAIPFTDPDGFPNTVRWGVEVIDQTWTDVTGEDPLIIYGGPDPNGIPLGNEGIGIPQYALHLHPDVGPFPGGQLYVGTCFGSPFDISADEEARIRRENVILEFHEPTFCMASTPQTASIAAPFLALAHSLMPRSVRSLFMRGIIRGPGAGAIDFSRFNAIAVNANAFLEFVVPPPANVVVGQPFEVRVRAFSAGNTSMERALVTLFILNNLGVPAGAVLIGDVEEFTVEDPAGVALFPAVSVGKPGVYRICASATLDGFTFAETCADMTNAKK